MKKRIFSSAGLLLLLLFITFTVSWTRETFYRGEKVPNWFGFLDLVVLYLPWVLAVPALIMAYLQMSKKELFALNFFSLLAWGYLLGAPFVKIIDQLYHQYFI